MQGLALLRVALCLLVAFLLAIPGPRRLLELSELSNAEESESEAIFRSPAVRAWTAEQSSDPPDPKPQPSWASSGGTWGGGAEGSVTLRPLMSSARRGLLCARGYRGIGPGGIDVRGPPLRV